MSEKHAMDAFGLTQAPLPGWPRPLCKEAMYGLLSDIVGAIDPHTEADPAAVASQTLAAFGNVIGPTPHFVVEADRHSCS